MAVQQETSASSAFLDASSQSDRETPRAHGYVAVSPATDDMVAHRWLVAAALLLLATMRAWIVAEVASDSAVEMKRAWCGPEADAA